MQSNMPAAGPSATLDTFDPAMIARPHAFYAQLRENAPIVWIPQFNAWVLTRYDDVRAVLRDHEQWSSLRNEDRRFADIDGVKVESVAPRGTLDMLSSDRPDHTRLRKLLTSDFAPVNIGRLQPHIDAIVADLLQDLALKPSFDVAEDLAVPLPVTVIAELLGIPPELGRQFKAWSDAVIEPLRPDAAADQVRARNAEVTAFREYLQARIDERQAQPTDDFIGRLVAAHDEEEKLTDAELLAAVNLLLLAGNETTTNLISNAVLALCRFPERQRELREHPELIDAAIEEFLRYDGSVQFTARRAIGPTEFHGQTIAPEQHVIIFLASANRDPAVFDEPDELRFDRTGNKHLGFGNWIHVCLGQYLARMETRAALLGLLNAYPQFELAVPESDIPYRPNFNLRGPKHLMIRPAAG
jgi:cytochrome P450